jgi:ADP-heptose:LPS heptosyltransferase
LASDFGVSVVVVGTEAERQITKRLKMMAKTAVADFTCLTDIPKLVALLRGARIVVSNDTGPGHIAGALGVPTVLIFGPTNPARVSPYGKPEAVVAVDGDKRGSRLHSSGQRYKIEAVGIKEVYAKVSKHLTSGIQ